MCRCVNVYVFCLNKFLNIYVYEVLVYNTKPRIEIFFLSVVIIDDLTVKY